ncbi:MAG: DUF2752 domain-containing protein [Planctomycetota bacterium]|nr:DUF2752 domain-containing protein [Planctomycetota bacterium]
MTSTALQPARPPVATPARRKGVPPRLFAGAVALACLALLLVASTLKPDAAGHGTHTQLGIPPCGWAVAFRTPCVTCGMTTSFAHFASGQFIQSFLTQPAGALLALATSVTFWGALVQAISGSRVDRLAARFLPTRALWIALALVIAAWIYKIIIWNPHA